MRDDQDVVESATRYTQVHSVDEFGERIIAGGRKEKNVHLLEPSRLAHLHQDAEVARS